MDFKQRYNSWLNNPYIDENAKAELLAIEDNEKEIEERFYKDLEFGTGGIRGILGAGDNRMNIYTIAKATQGLANYINKNKSDTKDGVAIAYDSRRMSPEFAETTALVLNNNGIKSYVYPSLRPTPMLSFAVRELNCIAGIVITASHNPPEYNGYKVYWSDGAQVPYPVDGYIIGEVNDVKAYADAKLMDKDEAVAKGLYNVISSEIDDKYMENVLAQVVNPEVIKTASDDLKIVYTPIHGSGNIPVRRVLKEVGFKHVEVVKEQELPDSDFTTVGYPNPEDPKVFTLAIELAKKSGADIIVGTDPDADRVGAVCKNSNGEYVVLNGNMTGVLLTHYILDQNKKNGTMPKNPAVISTIVSTGLTKVICEHYDVTYFETLTGFKNIGEKIKNFEENNSHEYMFGFEESYGCLKGTYARDKDAVVATLLLCEVAGYYKNRGMSLYDGILEIYKEFGYYTDAIENLTLKGLDGLKQMDKILSTLRSEPIKNVGNSKVVEMRDYKTGVINNLVDNTVSKTTVPASNVLYYVLEDSSWFCVRPSGTEPKIKIYFGVKDDTKELSDAKMQKLIKDVMAVINAI